MFRLIDCLATANWENRFMFPCILRFDILIGARTILGLFDYMACFLDASFKIDPRFVSSRI
jgi:hypothetical protein